jgi:hypothetical protein
MVSLTAMLAEFGPEMGVTSKLAADDPRVVKSYWQAVDKMIFGKPVRLPSTEIAKDRAAAASMTSNS